MTYLNILLSAFFTTIALFSLISSFQFFSNLVNIQVFDELEKKSIYESFTLSFLIIVGVHILQSIFIFISFDSPVKVVPGFLMHSDGFQKLKIGNLTLDMLVVGITYFYKRVKYGFYSKTELRKKIIMPWLLTFIGILVLVIFIYKDQL